MRTAAGSTCSIEGLHARPKPRTSYTDMQGVQRVRESGTCPGTASPFLPRLCPASLDSLILAAVGKCLAGAEGGDADGEFEEVSVEETTAAAKDVVRGNAGRAQEESTPAAAAS